MNEHMYELYCIVFKYLLKNERRYENRYRILNVIDEFENIQLHKEMYSLQKISEF